MDNVQAEPQVEPQKTGVPETPPVVPSNDKPTDVQDVIKRISSNPPDQATPPVKLDDEPVYNSSDIEKIEDPKARQVAQDLYKQFEKGYQKKFQSLAEQRKGVESLEQQLKDQTNWTPERVQDALKDPNFVQAAQSVVKTKAQNQPPSNWGSSDEEWSALTDSEKQRFQASENKVDALVRNQQKMLDDQEHERVKIRFPDYDRSVVEQAQSDLLSGKIDQETIKEMIWKARNFERYVDNSYKFGLQDRNGNIQEKITGSTDSTLLNVKSQDDIPKQKEGEKTSVFFSRLAQWRMGQQKK